MIFPPQPVELTSWSQLAGLQDGDFLGQPKWDGRRAVLLPGEGLFYRSGKRVNTRPWKEHKFREFAVPVDYELLRTRAIPLDIMVAGVPFVERVILAKGMGLDLNTFEVFSVDEINEALRLHLATRECDGIVLKRFDSLYASNEHAAVSEPAWLKIKRLVR